MDVALGLLTIAGLTCDAPVVNAATPDLELGTLTILGLNAVADGPTTPTLGVVTVAGLTFDIDDSRLGAVLLEWRYSGTALSGLAALETVGGLEITEAAGRNGIGIGRLEAQLDTAGVVRAAWRAPYSATFGDAVAVDADGDYVLRDGDDDDKFLRVTVTAERLTTLLAGATVRLLDRLGVGLTAGDVAAADAAAGIVASRILTLANLSPSTLLTDVRVWLDASTRFCEVSWNGVAFTTATTEAASLAAIGSKTITASGTQAMTLRRTIPAGTAAAPLETVILHASWDDGAGGRAYATIRDQYRIANTPVYRVYWKANAAPVPGVDAIGDTSATLPWTPTHVFSAGVWWLAVTLFDGYYESPPLLYRLEISGTALVDNPPAAPDRFWIEQTAGGQIYVRATYAPVADEAVSTLADSFALWYTTDGSAPGSGAADDTASATTAGIQATAKFDLGVIADGTTLRVIVRMRYGLVDSENEDDVSLLVTIGSAAVAGYAKSAANVDAVRK